MRQKPGPLRPSPTIDAPGTSTTRPASPDRPFDPDLDLRLPGRIRTDGSNQMPDIETSAPTTSTATSRPGITVTHMPDMQMPPRGPARSTLEPYVQNVSGEWVHDAQGLKSHKGRQFADIANDDGSAAGLTVMVAYHDLIKAYRARLPSERVPSGPPLYRVADTDLWSLDKPTETYPANRYTLHELGGPNASSAPLPNEQGYYAVHEWKETTNRDPMIARPYIGFAFQGKNGRMIKVDPSEARGDASVPLKLAHWTDAEIWNVYNLRDAEILTFRAEAEVLGGPPVWARRRHIKDDHNYLLDSMKWSHPQKSRSECAELLRSYNLSVTQRKRLRTEMENGFPEWAEEHKRLTRNTTDDQRFEQIAQELGPFSLRLREQGEADTYDLPPVNQRYEEGFLKSYLESAGYKRNKHDYLYRTDIPGMFRADLRTPFELARDKRLIKLRGNPSESTTKHAFSSTFGLADALNYMGFDYYSNPLHYNSQANRYPGHFSDSDSSSGYRHSTDEESDTSFEMDNSRDYPLRRRKQKNGFLYIIDTRNIEVVPRVENIYLNGRDFDGDRLEGRISMPTRGISSERIWLVNSSHSMAARVEDVFRQAGSDAADIEKATWEGIDVDMWTRSTPYDGLIAGVANSGGVVLNLPKGRNTLANDIIWPVPEHYRP
ncbi:hypothetical protein [Pseudomonas triticicola]|uniref:hypothetical protein n=1 Tax=Pseudomonas triticicola TaxID=2842345 RepID=UPI003EC0418B